MKTVYLIGGTMGVGKTAVCQELKTILPNSVLLDGDWCWDMNPFVVNAETTQMVHENICFMLNQFIKCSVYDNIIFCWVMHQQSIIDNIVNSLNLAECRLKIITLTADRQTITERLKKDVRAGARTADVIRRSMARMPLYARLNTVKVDTTGKTIRQIRQEISE